MCCGCNECPDECSFDVEVSVDDTVGTGTLAAIPTACDSCEAVSVADVVFFGDNTIAINVQGGTNIPLGTGAASETVSGGGVSYTRSARIDIYFECVFQSKKRKVLAVLETNDLKATEPFYAGIGFQKRQSLRILYSLTVELGCADAIDDITAVGSLSGVTINGTDYPWTVEDYVDVCEELDGNLEYQPCGDYLTPDIPEVTVTLSKRAGC